MQNNLAAALRIAVRVLTAVAEKRAPSAADTEELRRLMPSLPDLPPDELACDVIQQILKQRAEVRQTSVTSTLQKRTG